jgi:hypothetical protein
LDDFGQSAFDVEAQVPVLPEVVEAVSQTNGIGVNEQRLREPPETDASGDLLRASARSARLICLDANLGAWRSITNNFRSVTFVKQPPSTPEASSRFASSSASTRSFATTLQAAGLATLSVAKEPSRESADERCSVSSL